MPNSSHAPSAKLLRRRLSFRVPRALCLFALTLAPAIATPAIAMGATGNGRALGLMAVHGARNGSARSIEFNVGSGSSNAAKNGGKKPGGGSTQSNPLSYHGGGVFSSAYRVYDIYWVPSGYSVAAGYQTAVDGFIHNVGVDSGRTSNVFYSATQYADGSGSHVAYAASLGGSATATDPFPASGCSDSALPSGPCLSDTQVASEIQTVAAAHGWTVGYPNIFVMLMPKSVGNCASYSSGGLEGYCSFVNVCAWHHEWGGLFFAVQPYVGNVSGCQTGQSPTGVYDADQAINTMSHELNESVTDPAGGSWYDSNGYENGDKCAWNFGSALGGGSGTLYNQVINGAHYFIQQEWSNSSSKCVLTGA